MTLLGAGCGDRARAPGPRNALLPQLEGLYPALIGPVAEHPLALHRLGVLLQGQAEFGPEEGYVDGRIWDLMEKIAGALAGSGKLDAHHALKALSILTGSNVAWRGFEERGARLRWLVGRIAPERWKEAGEAAADFQDWICLDLMEDQAVGVASMLREAKSRQCRALTWLSTRRSVRGGAVASGLLAAMADLARRGGAVREQIMEELPWLQVSATDADALPVEYAEIRARLLWRATEDRIPGVAWSRVGDALGGGDEDERIDASLAVRQRCLHAQGPDPECRAMLLEWLPKAHGIAAENVVTGAIDYLLGDRDLQVQAAVMARLDAEVGDREEPKVVVDALTKLIPAHLPKDSLRRVLVARLEDNFRVVRMVSGRRLVYLYEDGAAVVAGRVLDRGLPNHVRMEMAEVLNADLNRGRMELERMVRGDLLPADLREELQRLLAVSSCP